MVASSDLHNSKQITSWKTLLKIRPKDPSIDAVLDAVREQRLEFGFWDDATRRIEKYVRRDSNLTPGASRQPVMVPFP